MDQRVLFIGGHSRSGSTLLSRLLGRDPRVVSVGELTFIADRGFRENQLCSCGKPFRECTFWSEVIVRVGGASPEEWFLRLASLRSELARIRQVPALALSGASRRTRFGAKADLASRSRASAHVAEYAQMLDMVFSAIRATAGAEVVVDSSKHPPYGFLLNECSGFDLYPAHLVRDCRAVAFSQMRTRARPEIYWTTELMPRFSPARSAFDWTLFNSLMHLLAAACGRYQRVRYEDAVRDPDGVAEQLLRWIGLSDAGPISAVDGEEHELSGNPMRLQREFKVVADDKWLRDMSRADKARATALSAPLLIGYRYPLRGRPSRPNRPAVAAAAIHAISHEDGAQS
jgi:hypothetical protein